jgi:uncharacterized protein (DUF1697 family)
MAPTPDPGSGGGSAAPGTDRKIALLRGINVGRSARIAMADLRACTEAAGCREVATVLATGNVIVTDPRPEGVLRSVLEDAYSQRFAYDAVVQVLARDAVETSVAGYPFESLAEHHDYLVFSDDPAVTVAVAEAMAATIDPAGSERVAAGPGCVYWRVSRGDTLTSPAAGVTTDRRYQRHLTMRNIKTVHKILAVG